VYWYICHELDIRLWGLTSRERLGRMLIRLGITNVLSDVRNIPTESSVLIIRGDFIFDDRVLRSLSEEKNVILKMKVGKHSIPVAAHVEGVVAQSVSQGMQEEQFPEIPNLRTVTLEDLSGSFSNELRKADHPYVLPLREDNRKVLEEHLFSGSYKGVTDLVTKFCWPVPAQWATRFCALKGVSPNQVTSLSLGLVILAGIFFSYGYFFLGLAFGWVMTFLDTVDGKLARVTVTSSKWGNIFDHGIDLIHPPLWYLAWGLGLFSFSPIFSSLTLGSTCWVIVIGYILGRIVEGIFQWWLGGFVIFCWKPFDSYFRLITARRNPNMIFLTGSILIGRPDLGLEAVAVWTVLSTLILLGRLAMALLVKGMKGSITSWLAEIDPVNGRDSLAVRLFTNPPAKIT
ncbi:MAG: CDP-alcohol phosphatidyltransferase family protein, partial [Nitrospirota bacterium]